MWPSTYSGSLHSGSLLWESTLGVYYLGLPIWDLADHSGSLHSGSLLWESTLGLYSLIYRFWIWLSTLGVYTLGVYSGSLLWESTLGVCTVGVYFLGPPILGLEQYSSGTESLDSGSLLSRATVFGLRAVFIWD